MRVTQLLLAGIVWLVTLENSYAYIDPGTGSFLVQMLIAGFLGAIFYLKLYWRKVKTFITEHWNSVKSRLTDPVPEAEDGEDQSR